MGVMSNTKEYTKFWLTGSVLHIIDFIYALELNLIPLGKSVIFPLDSSFPL